jgi:hypothetical protein
VIHRLKSFPARSLKRIHEVVEQWFLQEADAISRAQRAFDTMPYSQPHGLIPTASFCVSSADKIKPLVMGTMKPSNTPKYIAMAPVRNRRSLLEPHIAEDFLFSGRGFERMSRTDEVGPRAVNKNPLHNSDIGISGIVLSP